MPRNYSLEDVETLRAKAGVSYEDAVSLLEKYDGDVARALIELEKRGQLGKESQGEKFDLESACEWIRNMWHKGLITRLVIERKGELLINLPLLIVILMLLLGPYAVLCAAVITLISGCSISLRRDGQQAQTLFKGEEAPKPAPAEEPIEPSIQPDEKEEKKDDDFPSITIS